MMIQSWANSRSRRFYEDGKISKFRSLENDTTDELLAALNAAKSLNDLSPLKKSPAWPPGNRNIPALFEMLRVGCISYLVTGQVSGL